MDGLDWDALLAANESRLRALCRRYLRNDADAEDALQATWLKALQGAGNLREASYAGTWLYTIALRECADRVRNGKRRGVTVPLLDEAMGAAPQTSSLEALEMWRLAQADPEWPLLHARFVLGHTGPEVARARGVTEMSLKMRLHRARIRLMAQAGGA